MDYVATMRSTYDRLNAGDLAGFGDMLADTFLEHEEGGGFPPTKAGTLEFFRALRAAFPDWRMSVDDVIASGDKAVARVTVTGTHQGEFMGIAATGVRVQVGLIDIMRFDADGLVSEHWGVADMMSLMRQLGVAPAAEERWAQLITMRLKPGKDTAGLSEQLQAAEQPGSGLVRSLLMRDQKDPAQLYTLVVFESEEKARARERDPRRQEQLEAARAVMADIVEGPPEFTDLTVAEEWTGR